MNHRDDEDLRGAFADRVGRPGEGALDDALPDDVADALWDVARGAAGGPLIDDVLRNPDLAQLWRATFALADEAGLRRRGADSPACARGQGRVAANTSMEAKGAVDAGTAATDQGAGRGWVVLATAAAAALIVVWRPRFQDGGRPQPAGAPVEPVVRAIRYGVIEATPSAVALPRTAFVLRWRGGPADARYDVQVDTVSGERRVATGLDLALRAFTVPVEKLADVPSQATLVWRVTAVTADGRRVDSPGFEIRVQ